MKRYKGNLMHAIKWKKQIWRGSVLCDSSCTTSEKGKITETARKSVVSRGWGGGQEWINRAQMIFMALYYQIDIIWYHNSGYMHYKPIQKQMYYNTKSEHLS